MRNIFGWMGMREQQKALEASQQHMEQVRQVVHLLQQALEHFVGGQLERVHEIHERVTAAERQADELRRDLLDQMSEGMFLPADREDLVQMVEHTDDVADYANAASRLLVLFQAPPPEELKGDLLRFAEILVRAVEQLAMALEKLLAGQRRETLHLCTAVERCEEEGDALKASLYRRLLALDLPAGKMLLLHDLIEAMENTADRAEDSADLVRVLAVKIR